MRILIVDDDPLLLDVLEIGLTSFGFQVHAVKDGQQALGLIKTDGEDHVPVELMVTDRQMPGMDGIELIKKAKKLRPDLLFILMTGYFDNHVREEVMKLNHCRVLEKPFKLDTLLEVINETSVNYR